MVFTSSTRIDPCFACKLCGVKPYIEPTQQEPLGAMDKLDKPQLVRTDDPARPGEPLNWLTSDCCENCGNVLHVTYRYDVQEGQRFAEYNGKEGKLIKHILVAPGLHDEFLTRKTTFNKAQVSSPYGNSLSQSMGLGSHVIMSNGTVMEDELYAFDHYAIKVARFGRYRSGNDLSRATRSR